MNERIKELAKQCWDTRPEGQLHFDNEKFAELIVKECGEFLKEFQVDPIHLQEDWDKGANWVYGEAGSLLNKHFGVEE
jgi:hypothetical protein